MVFSLGHSTETINELTLFDGWSDCRNVQKPYWKSFIDIMFDLHSPSPCSCSWIIPKTDSWNCNWFEKVQMCIRKTNVNTELNSQARRRSRKKPFGFHRRFIVIIICYWNKSLRTSYSQKNVWLSDHRWDLRDNQFPFFDWMILLNTIMWLVGNGFILLEKL